MTIVSDSIIIRDFVVDLALVGMAAIDATGWEKYVSESVVEAMPRATTPTGQIHFFCVGKRLKRLGPGEAAIEAVKRCLHLCDPHTLAAFNAANPQFADTHPNLTEWVNKAGEPCYASFARWGADPHVFIEQKDKLWDEFWWFAGVPIEAAT